MAAIARPAAPPHWILPALGRIQWGSLGKGLLSLVGGSPGPRGYLAARLHADWEGPPWSYPEPEGLLGDGQQPVLRQRSQ